MSEDLRLGAWVRTGRLVGLVAAVKDNEVAVFDPAGRQLARVPRSAVELLPAGGVRVTCSVELPLAHGVDEDALRRWVAALTDQVLRERAAAALADAGLDAGAALPRVRVDVEPAGTSGAVCLCGARTPAPAGVSMPCSSCGREAVSAAGEDQVGQAGAQGS